MGKRYFKKLSYDYGTVHKLNKKKLIKLHSVIN